ncbi:MAG: hypothetical protein JWL76_821 [Thermoleophilia bacterium]|nr:hypothetical protein [Thermoleophilia bacterium]
MTALNVIRTWSDHAALAAQRASESTSALATLRGDASALDEITHALGSGSSWDDPFDAALELAEQGNRGVWDGWTKADAAHSLLGRAVAEHPGGAGLIQLQRAEALAEQASGDLGNWIATGGRSGTFDAVESVVRSQLDEARSIAERIAAQA